MCSASAEALEQPAKQVQQHQIVQQPAWERSPSASITVPCMANTGAGEGQRSAFTGRTSSGKLRMGTDWLAVCGGGGSARRQGHEMEGWGVEGCLLWIMGLWPSGVGSVWMQAR